jgi:hypothetical protein
MFYRSINWRINLFALMLILLLINSLAHNPNLLCSGWWFEHRHCLNNGFQVVRRTGTSSVRYRNFCFSFGEAFFKTLEKVMAILLFRFLSAMVGLYLIPLKYIVRRLIIKHNRNPFCVLWETPIELQENTMVLKIGISFCAEKVPADIAEINVFPEKMHVKKCHEFPMIVYSDETVDKNVRPTAGATPPVFRCPAYAETIENEMRKFYNSLSEKDRRRYAGVEALKTGHGSIVYISKILGCSRKTVSRGIVELKEMRPGTRPCKRIRKAGGGRKCYRFMCPGIDEKFFDIIKNYTAGDPMKEGALWTNLSYERIAEELFEKHNVKVSTKVTRQLVKNHRFGKRKLKKKMTMKQVENRNEQFENIAAHNTVFLKSGNPIISMDGKKKEEIGNFFREGYFYGQSEISVYDHDYKSFGKGTVTPHGIYDVVRNKGWIGLGTSKDTSEFACDSLRKWWHEQGVLDYPDASALLILCDGGGSNSSRHYIFKEDLQKLADEIGIEIRIAHYPPYTSKYNPIEHQMFSHVSRACRGAVFSSVEHVAELMKKTKTKKGLKVSVRIFDKIYETGRKVKDGFKENMPIIFDEYLPRWNYRAIPNG